MSVFNSPLRYPGGKGRLAQYIIDLMEMNDIVGADYVEPYAGGAGIAVTLLFLEYADHIYLNDLNKSVFSFWHSVLNQPDAMCKLIRDTPLTMREWRRQKAIQTAENIDRLELGFSTFYLNRTNRSGIIQGGVIGGQRQTGRWKLGARYNRIELARRVEKIASYSQRISLSNLDAAEFLTTSLRKVPAEALVYLDPPYYSKGERLYENRYGHSDHAKIAALVRNLRQKWIVSYDNDPAISRLYGKYRQQIFNLSYSANSRYDGTEVMIFCKGLKTPGEVESWRGIAV